MSALPCPVADPFAAADQAYATITEFLHSKEACQVKHSELERQLEGMGRELMRKLLQAHLDMRQPGQAVEPVRDAAGTTLTPTPVHARSLESIFGEVEVARTGYGAAGTPSLHPLDGALNLPPEKYSLEVRRRVAMEAAKSSFDEGVKTLEVYTGAHVPKRQFEELVIRAAQDFEAFYAERQAGARADPQAGSILVLTVDGKGVVMRPEDLPRTHATRCGGAGQDLHGTAGERSPPPCQTDGRGGCHLYRRALCAHARRNPDRFSHAAGNGVRAATARTLTGLGQPGAVAGGGDPGDVRRGGAPGSEGTEALGRSGGWPSSTDCSSPADGGGAEHPTDHRRRLIHVAQYVWKAAGAFFPNQEIEPDRWTRGRLLEILRGKASLVAAGIRLSATRREMAAAETEPVDDWAGTLLNYAPYLQSSEALAEGVPIATGVIEGACRHLVEDRMNLTGARWSLTGAEAVLRLRALRSSNDFDAYWKFHEQQEYERHHASHYADHRVPETVPSAASSSRPSRRGTLKKSAGRNCEPLDRGATRVRFCSTV